MVNQVELLSRFLPPGSAEMVTALIMKLQIQLRISRKRSSKVGDYRPPRSGHLHRISLNHDLNPYAFLLTFLHEAAHLVVYEQYGRAVQPHGKEWKQAYASLLEPFFARYLFPADIETALKDFFNRRGESNRTDLELNTILRQYDPPNGTITVSELPDKALFRLADGRLFVKGMLLRKRYRCLCLNNRRHYLVSHLMEVYPVHYQYSLNFP
ncbi:MAG TPA: SprT-like domain-containing protein [Bacteroidales bacterium]|nr:SprT-like domain-containing protein [Bacteroidales bacterium]HSA43676.1 SprT-like domain-containing protein [Bacteroidales bacterium]